MKITVAVPHYKSFRSLVFLLKNLAKQQTHCLNLKKDVQVIVVNDDMEEKIQSSDLSLIDLNLIIVNKKNGGVASARNKAIKIAKGELIFFLDVDCCPTQNWLQSMWYRFQQDKKVQAIGGRIEPLLAKGLVNEYYNITNRLKRPIIDKETGEIVTIITANCGFHINALRSIGGFDFKNFSNCPPGGEDADLTFRLKQKGYKLGYEKNAVALHRYPCKFRTIFNKYANYGRGMKVYCLARRINPVSIRQPRLSIRGFIAYNLQVFKEAKISFCKFSKQVDLKHSLLFTFFDIIRYFAHGYGFFIKR